MCRDLKAFWYQQKATGFAGCVVQAECRDSFEIDQKVVRGSGSRSRRVRGDLRPLGPFKVVGGTSVLRRRGWMATDGENLMKII